MENKNKIIIIALIVVIVALLASIVAITMPNMNKIDTNVAYKGTAILNESGSISIKLTDVSGTPLEGQTVNITVIDKDKSSDYHSVVTNADGVGKLKLEKSAGKYNLVINYGGNDKYNGCNATKKITIQEAAEAEPAQSAPAAYAYRSDGTPMYSQAEVDSYMGHKYGLVNYHIGDNGYIDMDEPGFDDAGHRLY